MYTEVSYGLRTNLKTLLRKYECFGLSHVLDKPPTPYANGKVNYSSKIVNSVEEELDADSEMGTVARQRSEGFHGKGKRDNMVEFRDNRSLQNRECVQRLVRENQKGGPSHNLKTVMGRVERRKELFIKQTRYETMGLEASSPVGDRKKTREEHGLRIEGIQSVKPTFNDA
ncbi:hypothetical protein RJ641_010714 [Dillenia turbinata]|uniref:Uncharacterized protein n=1 Tax=Dillenia turbinata TaxID=194707 RepID=A0AAN8V414_9MAGN